MQALRKTTAMSGLEFVADIPVPTPNSQNVLIHVAAAGICGSDLHAYQWSSGYEFMVPHMPLTLGHEFSGRAEQVPAHQNKIMKGDNVTIWPTIACKKCVACNNNNPQACLSRTIIGLHCDGGFAEFVRVPLENCFRLPTEMPIELGALTEPVSIAIHAVKTADLQQGNHLVVFGPGPIGLFVALYAQSQGAKVVLVGYNDQARLKLAQDMGVTLICDSATTDLSAFLSTHLNDWVDRVIEAVGATICLEQGLQILSPAGILVIAGIHSDQFSFDVTPFVRRKQQIRGAHDTTETSFQAAIEFINANQGIFEQAITHEFQLAESENAFAIALQKQAMKVLLRP